MRTVLLPVAKVLSFSRDALLTSAQRVSVVGAVGLLILGSTISHLILLKSYERLVIYVIVSAICSSITFLVLWLITNVFSHASKLKEIFVANCCIDFGMSILFTPLLQVWMMWLSRPFSTGISDEVGIVIPLVGVFLKTAMFYLFLAFTLVWWVDMSLCVLRILGGVSKRQSVTVFTGVLVISICTNVLMKQLGVQVPHLRTTEMRFLTERKRPPLPSHKLSTERRMDK